MSEQSQISIRIIDWSLGSPADTEKAAKYIEELSREGYRIIVSGSVPSSHQFGTGKVWVIMSTQKEC